MARSRKRLEEGLDGLSELDELQTYLKEIQSCGLYGLLRERYRSSDFLTQFDLKLYCYANNTDTFYLDYDISGLTNDVGMLFYKDHQEWVEYLEQFMCLFGYDTNCADTIGGFLNERFLTEAYSDKSRSYLDVHLINGSIYLNNPFLSFQNINNNPMQSTGVLSDFVSNILLTLTHKNNENKYYFGSYLNNGQLSQFSSLSGTDNKYGSLSSKLGCKDPDNKINYNYKIEIPNKCSPIISIMGVIGTSTLPIHFQITRLNDLLQCQKGNTNIEEIAKYTPIYKANGGLFTPILGLPVPLGKFYIYQHSSGEEHILYVPVSREEHFAYDIDADTSNIEDLLIPLDNMAIFPDSLPADQSLTLLKTLVRNSNQYETFEYITLDELKNLDKILVYGKILNDILTYTHHILDVLTNVGLPTKHTQFLTKKGQNSCINKSSYVCPKKLFTTKDFIL